MRRDDVVQIDGMVLGHPRYPICVLQAQRQQGVYKITKPIMLFAIPDSNFCEVLVYLHEPKVQMAPLQETMRGGNFFPNFY